MSVESLILPALSDKALAAPKQDEKELKKEAKVNAAKLKFDEKFFRDLLAKWPLLKRFVTDDIQVSSDQMVSSNLVPTNWHIELRKALGVDEAKITATSYPELERTVLSIMFFYATQESDQESDKEALTFIRENGSDLEKEDLEAIRKLMPKSGKLSEEDRENFILSIIFKDIGKINAIGEAFEKHDVATQDQDLRHDYILGLDSNILTSFFNELTEKQITYLKKGVFKLHLGHAVQAECTEKKFEEAAEFLRGIPAHMQEAVINAALVEQLTDVAGARGAQMQKGFILLNRAILKNYLELKKTLIRLAKGENPKQVYWDFATTIIREKKIEFKTAKFNQMTDARDVEAFSEQGLVWRLTIQLRIPQIKEAEDAKREALLAETAITNALENNEQFKTAIRYLQIYNQKVDHTFTYGPAIFPTLKEQATILLQQNKLKGIANNAIEYAVIAGVIIQGMACKEYLAALEKTLGLSQNPLNFNALNKQLNSNPEIGLALITGKSTLKINADGSTQIQQDKQEEKLDSKQVGPQAKKAQPEKGIAEHYKMHGALKPPVASLGKAKLPEEKHKSSRHLPTITLSEYRRITGLQDVVSNNFGEVVPDDEGVSSDQEDYSLKKIASQF